MAKPGNSAASPLRTPNTSGVFWVVVSVFTLVAALLILAVLLFRAELLVRLGLVGNLYYFALVPLGFSVSAFLFGVFKSYAHYSGKVLGGKLVLSGPIVGFALTIIGGFYLPPKSTAFAVTMFVHGESGRHELPLRNSGQMMIDLGPDRRQAGIGENGQAIFSGIPSGFRGQEVNVMLQSEAYEMVDPVHKYRIEDGSIYVAVRPRAAKLAGYVHDGNDRPVTGAKVRYGDASSNTDNTGRFILSIRATAGYPPKEIHIFAQGYVPFHDVATLGSNEMDIQLRRLK